MNRYCSWFFLLALRRTGTRLVPDTRTVGAATHSFRIRLGAGALCAVAVSDAGVRMENEDMLSHVKADATGPEVTMYF